MTHEVKVIQNDGAAATARRLNQVIFRKAANASALAKYRSLFPGIGFAAGYKVTQRVYKWTGQLYVKDFLQQHFGR